MGMYICPVPGEWETTSLSPGPLPTGKYNMNISSLSANRIYEYRAYAIINGTEYYGNVLTGYTAPIISYPPSVITGNVSASTITTSSAIIVDNIMSNCNNSPISEYGILFTHNSDSSKLIYENVPSIVHKNSTIGSISNGTHYSGMTNGLAPNTMTYFRAFAKNSAGIGYGNIKSFLTKQVNYINLCNYNCTNSGGQDVCSFDYISATPPLSNGECYSITFQMSLGTIQEDSGSWASIQLFCNASQVFCCVIPANTCQNPSYTTTIEYDDSFCSCIKAYSVNTAKPLCSSAQISIYSVNPIVGGAAIGTSRICSKVCTS